MEVLISADKFKDCLSAEAVCEAIAEGIRALHPHYRLQICPLTDGGDGFASVLTTAANGLLAGEEVSDPLGRQTQAAFGIVPVANIPSAARTRLRLPEGLSDENQIAIVEMAAASGLHLLRPEERDPWQTDTTGTGELICAAQRADVAAILIGVGGSATNDLGLGALAALGYRFLDTQGQSIRPCPANWHKIARIEGALPAGLPPLRIACDVTNPLLGPKGAAAVYAPQKGLQARDLPQLEAQAERIARLLCAHHHMDFDTLCTHPGAGAAGGIAFGLMSAAQGRTPERDTGRHDTHNAPAAHTPTGCAGAEHTAAAERSALIAGFDLVADWLRLHEHLQRADIVITGEGRFDASSLAGKGPGELARAALQAGKPVHVFAGKADAPPRRGLYLHPITPEHMPLEQALENAAALLRQTVAEAFGATASGSTDDLNRLN